MINYGLGANINPVKLRRFSNTNPHYIIPARVKDIILNPENENFKNYGEWSSIGLIFWDSVSNPSSKRNISLNGLAKPLMPNLLNYPIIDEIVYIISLPDPDIQNNTNSTTYYYFNPINIWGSVHHNVLPDNVWGDDLPPSQEKDYEETQLGSVRKVTNPHSQEDDIDKYGKTFIENMKVRNLLPFEGDVILEGRWGNSLRFSSTIKDKRFINNWSTHQGPGIGDPITIIRNGQPRNSELKTETWVPIQEDINKDQSSLYLTSQQQIPIEVSSDDYTSYETPPTNPKEYIQPQAILSSGRLLFNAKSGDLLLSAKNSINLNSQDTVNIDVVNKFVISGTKNPIIYLGNKDKDKTEPLLLGDKTVEMLDNVIGELITVYNALGVLVGNLGIPNMDVVMKSHAASLKTMQEKNQLESLKQNDIRIRKNED